MASVIAVMDIVVLSRLSAPAAARTVWKGSNLRPPVWPPKRTYCANRLTTTSSPMRTATVRSKRRAKTSVRTRTAIAPHKKMGMNVAFAPDSAKRASTSATQVRRCAFRPGSEHLEDQHEGRRRHHDAVRLRGAPDEAARHERLEELPGVVVRSHQLVDAHHQQRRCHRGGERAPGQPQRNRAKTRDRQDQRDSRHDLAQHRDRVDAGGVIRGGDLCVDEPVVVEGRVDEERDPRREAVGQLRDEGLVERLVDARRLVERQVERSSREDVPAEPGQPVDHGDRHRPGRAHVHRPGGE